MPIHVTRHFNNTPGEYPIYSVAEAEERGLEFTHWTQARWDITDEEVWAVDDSGEHVVRVFDASQLGDRDGNRYAIQYKLTVGRPIAQYWTDSHEVSNQTEYYVEEYLEEGGYSYSRPQSWQEREARRNRTKRAVELYARLMLRRRGDLSDEDWRRIGEVYRPDEKNPEATARVLLRQDEVRTMASRRIAEILTDADLTKDDVVQMYEELFEEALQAEHTSTALETLRDLRDMHDMKPDEVEQTAEATFGLDQLQENVEEAEAEVIDDDQQQALPEA